MNHRDRHPTDVEGCFGCKALGVALSAKPAGPKVTTHHTDTAVVTETERSIERQDTHIAMREPVRPHWKEPDA